MYKEQQLHSEHKHIRHCEISFVFNEYSDVLNFVHVYCFSWKTAERLFLDAMEKIKAIGNEVTANLFNWKRIIMT